MTKKKENTVFDMIKLDFKRSILGSIVLNVLFLIFGAIIFMNPVVASNTVAIIIGIYFIIVGLFSIYEFFLRKEAPIFSYIIFKAIMAIIIGVFIMSNPFRFTKILTFSLGLYLIVLAISKFLETIKLKKCGFDGWIVMLITSIVLLAFGIFIAINPMSATMDFVVATGIFIILSSILEICNLVMVYSKAKDIEKLFEKVN